MTAPSDKPRTYNGNLKNLPPALEPLTALPYWVLWRWEKRKGKWTKPPYQPNGQKAKSDDPATWSTYDEVIAVVDQYDGIGFMLPEHESYAIILVDDGDDLVVGRPRCRVVALRLLAIRLIGRLGPLAFALLPPPQDPVWQRCERLEGGRQVLQIAVVCSRLVGGCGHSSPLFFASSTMSSQSLACSFQNG